MSFNRRCKNWDWNVVDVNGNAYTGQYGHAHLAVLMDLRDELQTLNRLLHCPNFTGIPRTLRTIARQTQKPARKRKVRR